MDWATAEGEVHFAECPLFLCDTVVMLRVQVNSLGESGWDWHAWDQTGRDQQRYGLACTLNEAKAMAESALDSLARELG